MCVVVVVVGLVWQPPTTTTGIDGCASLLPPLYARCTRVAAGDGAVVLGCFRADSAEKIAEGRGGASGWRGRASLQLPASAINGKSAEKIAEDLVIRRWVTCRVVVLEVDPAATTEMRAGG